MKTSLFLYIRVVGESKDEVYRHVVEDRQLYQNIRGDISLAKLIVAVYLL